MELFILSVSFSYLYFVNVEGKNHPISCEAAFVHSLETSEKWRFYDVFMGYRNAGLAWNELMIFFLNIHKI